MERITRLARYSSNQPDTKYEECKEWNAAQIVVWAFYGCYHSLLAQVIENNHYDYD